MGALRLLLALSVLAAHTATGTLSGIAMLAAPTAVQGFYIVSGFLITMVLNERAQYRDVVKFYVSRYLRLWPAYAITALLSLALINPGILQGIAKLNWPSAIFVGLADLTLFLQDTFLFLAADTRGAIYATASFKLEPSPLHIFLPVPQAWSLGVELLFYLIAPFLCRSVVRVALLFAFGLAVRVAIGAWHPEFDPWGYRFAPAEMMLFAAGGLAYFAGRKLRDAPAALVAAPAGILFCILLGIVLSGSFRLQFLNAASPVLMLNNIDVLLIITVSTPFLFYASRKIGADTFLGELSYPLYLCHWLAI